MFSLSTAFSISASGSWPRLLAETKKLGFDSLELNVEIPGTWMPEIEKSVVKGEIRISSLHNYCPAVENLPEGRSIYSGYLLTSDSEEERALAVQYSLRTVDWAARLNARAIVIHAGEIQTEPSGREFYRYIQQFGYNGKLYNRYLDAIRADRQRKSDRYLELLVEGLDTIVQYAGEKNVCIGLENRFFIHEIPDLDEMKKLLARYDSRHLGYWHDVGHAEVFVRQGWVKRHEDFLEPLSSRLIGMHIHDLKGLSDHYAPGSGDFDFSRLRPFAGDNNIIKVLEIHQKSTKKEVKDSVECLVKAGVDGKAC